MLAPQNRLVHPTDSLADLSMQNEGRTPDSVRKGQRPAPASRRALIDVIPEHREGLRSPEVDERGDHTALGQLSVVRRARDVYARFGEIECRYIVIACQRNP